MTVRQSPVRIDRRKFLIGAAGAATAAGAAALVGCERAEERGVDWKGELTSTFIREPVPATDPDSRLWKKSRPVLVPLTPQMSALPFRPQPAFPSITVRSLHDGDRIAFLLTWEDADADHLTIKTDQFRDACGVLLGPGDAPAVFYMMGTADVPASIMCWRADWQKDLDEGYQDLEVAFPNVAFDYYPPFPKAERPLRISDEYPAEGRPWLVGWNAGNSLSVPSKPSPVEKLIGRGPGTLTHLPVQDATGKGVWAEGRWKVVLSRPFDASNEGETALEAGKDYAVVFSVWSGSAGDRGSRKSPSGMGKLHIEGT